MADTSPNKLANADSQPYWSGVQEGRLMFKQCLQCRYVQFPPRHLCPKCWSDQAQWVASKGEGSVHSYTIVHRAPTAEYAGKVPYVIAMVELADAPRMIANIVGDDALEVSIGDKVDVVFEQREGYALPQFQRRAQRPSSPV